MKILIYFFLINLLLIIIDGLKLKKKQYGCKYINEYLDAKKKNKRKETENGHYEKYIKTEHQIIFVPGDKPSGLPGAFVVSEEEAKGIN